MEDAFILVVVPAFIVFRYGIENAVTPEPQIRSIVSCNCCRGFTDRRGSIFFCEKKLPMTVFLKKPTTKQPCRSAFSSVRRSYAEVSFKDSRNQLSIITVNYRSYFQSTSDFPKSERVSPADYRNFPLILPEYLGSSIVFSVRRCVSVAHASYFQKF